MLSEVNKNHVLVAGFAQLPKGTPVYEMQKTIGCILIIDSDTNIIIEATFTFLQQTTNSFIGGLIKGKSIENIEEIIESIENQFIVPPQKAVIQALIMAKKYYDEKFLKKEQKSVAKN